ncbi:lipid A deacylase LpxR family protein [Longimicrobium terrae]|uniref:Lipid A deacylase LpxR family protein n=1 Tax=Longimicrobium terrae TaxID=1639882 RepID=A0A841GJS0_9BACT|nr:lipid A deacylase LpxR family protein [Longimicrobium terrae]MBB4634159.1 hypothetical protein [Longimicrobium terrae]MBB6068951.1 hypothetical protein [Longimicrobium terrae]NNC28130.1 lipid A deacylase LpxR family protein [Longimicrobium terrae]
MRSLFLLPLAAALLAAPAAAQLLGVQVTSDNDAYDFWIPPRERPDYEYSNGIRIAAEMGGARGWGRLARRVAPCAADGGEGAECTTTVELGQRLYTARVDNAQPTPGSRHFAGWLYVGGTGQVVNGPVRHTFGAEVGVTGPPSLAAQLMKTVHSIGGFWNPDGWDHQLGFEPGVTLRYGVERRLAEARVGGGRAAEVAVHAGAGAGNVYTGAQAGLQARAGLRLPDAWTAARQRGPSLYVTGGVEGAAVARNLFLDGNTFSGEPPRVHRKPLLANANWGIGAVVGGASLEYRVRTRTREYREEPGGHTYGSFEVTWRPARPR